MNTVNRICEEIALLAESYLNLSEWGFQESARSGELGDSKVPFLIYNSQLCRVKIFFHEWHPPHQTKEYAVKVHYGRLNAPDDTEISIMENEECYCWHGVNEPLHFLDGRTPDYTVENLFSHNLTRKFRKRFSSENLRHKLPEWEIRKHAFIWEKYAPHLFELFDLQRTDLWEKYRLFLKKVYDIEGRPSFIKPSMDKVC